MIEPRQIAETLVGELKGAWNSADADLVTIRGDHMSGQATIVAGHQHVFDTISRGSTNRSKVLDARQLDDRVIVTHVKATLNAPSGPLAGEHDALATAVLVQVDDDWRIGAFHNTLITA